MTVCMVKRDRTIPRAQFPIFGIFFEMAAGDPRDAVSRNHAITVFRVWDGMLLARARPRRLPGSRGPPDTLTIQTFVVLTAGLAGFYPSQRQPMPGTQKLWQGLQLLKADVIGDEAMPAGNESEPKD